MGDLAHALVTEVSSSIEDIVWASAFGLLHPGSFAIVMVNGPNPSRVSVHLRRAGFEFRDTLMLFSGEPSLKATPCFIFRKPLEEASLFGQVLATGTGSINIDGCRVKHASKADFEAHKTMVDAVKAKGGVRGDSWKNSSDLSGANDVSTAGRWPANVLFVHARGCKLVGEEKVAAPVINRFTDGAKPFGNGAGHPFESHQTGDENGEESIGVYQCEEKCPARALNVESGDRPSTLTGRASPNSTHGNPSAQDAANGLFWGNGGGQVYADSGGASRFFSQFETSPELKEWLLRLAVPPGGRVLDLHVR